METVLEQMDLTRDEPARAMRDLGEVRSVTVDGAPAGSVWIER